jgi:predicted unusual protein kinase regulating ubiquinone biosynthesis (AarF/ABC1/UbiB family)
MMVSIAIVLAVVVVAIALAFPVPRRSVVLALVLARRTAPVLLRRLRLGRRDYSLARAIRLAFEDLGPAYIKFGQMIASSPTAFPESVTREFARCLDEVRPLPAHTVWAILEAELGRPPDEVFASIETSPLASASIAQVHAARLEDGTDVVIKVQRPGIRGRVEHDLGLMRFVARLAMRHAELRRANLVGVVDDFLRTIREEMDFRLEAANMDAFRDVVQREGISHIAHAPRVIRELSTDKVLTMERLRGVRIDDKVGVETRVRDVVQVLRDNSEVFWTCVFLGGFFHGDIHAGNIMVLDDGRLGFLDFGIFGRFSMDDRVALSEWVRALVGADGELLATSIKRMGAVPADVDWGAFVADVTDSFLPLRAFRVDRPEMLEQFFPKLRAMAARHNAQLPANFVLILKQLTYFGRYVMIHDPSFNENVDPETQVTFVKIFQRFGQLQRQHAAAPDVPAQQVG